MARPHPALVEVAAGRSLPPVDDVDELVRSAVEHRMAGLLFSCVQAGHLTVPGPWLRALAREDLRTQAHQQRLWATLQAVSRRLREGGFEVATAKGVTAQARWYDRAGERPCADVDLLVSPHEIPSVEEIVRLIDPDHPLLPKVRSLVACGYLEWVDIEASPGMLVDLHMDLFKVGIPSRRRDVIWDRTRDFTLPNHETVRVPDPETSLIHFLLHLTKDRFSYLLGLVDVCRILEREELDWSFIDRFLRDEALETPVRLALDTVVDTLQIPHPHRRPVAGWRAGAWRTLWPAGSVVQGHEGRSRHTRRQFFIPFLVRGRGRAALHWWLRRVFPPAVLVERWYGRGPYLWRLTSGRLARLLPRRRARACG